MIAAENVTVRYGRGRKKLVALDGLSLAIGEGDLFALLGPNGAGKSTALRCFLGLIRPDAGRVTLFGKEPEPGSPLFRRIGYVPEEPHYHLYLTVEEALMFYGSLQGYKPSPALATELLERFGLAEHRSLRLAKCSKGMKQKLGVAAALLGEPEILILDEPTRGLDPVIVRDLREVLLDANRRGVTVLLSSHVLSEVESICNRVAILRRGRLLLSEDLANLRQPKADRYRVELQVNGEGELPEFFDLAERRGSLARGEIEAEQAPLLFSMSRDAGWEVVSCARMERTLEDSFFAVLEEQA